MKQIKDTVFVQRAPYHSWFETENIIIAESTEKYGLNGFKIIFCFIVTYLFYATIHVLHVYIIRSNETKA